jgi:hypothetical protein
MGWAAPSACAAVRETVQQQLLLLEKFLKNKAYGGQARSSMDELLLWVNAEGQALTITQLKSHFSVLEKK